MIAATEADRPMIEAFLHRHFAEAMFPLSNLARHGMAGGHPRAMRFWLRWAAGEVTDVLGVSDEGRVFPICPTGPWGKVAVVLAGQPVRGIIGAADQVAACRAVLGLTAKGDLDEIEPHYALSLTDLIVPDALGFRLLSLHDASLETATRWRAAFCEEAMGYEPKDAMDRAMADVTHYLELDTHRILVKGQAPVAMTGFNAVLPHVVQVGGVYTPPDQRGRGYARLAVALHLAEVRENGVRDAVLSAANAAAARAYEAIGFRRCGSFAILDYAGPQVIHG